MKDYSMFNKIKIWFSLLIIKIEDYIYPDMSYTLDKYLIDDRYMNEDGSYKKEIWIPESNDYKRTFYIPIGNITKDEIGQIISEYKEDINWDDDTNELVFKSNKKEDLN